MPDDNPLDPTQQEAPQESGGDSISLSQAVSLIQEAMSPMADRINELSTSQDQANHQLQNFTEELGGAIQQNTTPQESADFLTEITSGNAEVAIGKIIDQKLGTLTPLLANLMKSGSKAFTDIEATQVDQKFGSGAWDKFFQTPMQHIMDSYAKTNPAALSDSQIINREVNGLKGQLLDQLVEHRDASQQETSKQENSDLSKLTEGIMSEFKNRTNGTGGIRPITPVGAEVTDDIRGYLAERDRAIGSNTNPKDWLKTTDFGNDLDSFINHQKEISKDNGAAQ